MFQQLAYHGSNGTLVVDASRVIMGQTHGDPDQVGCNGLASILFVLFSDTDTDTDTDTDRPAHTYTAHRMHHNTFSIKIIQRIS